MAYDEDDYESAPGPNYVGGNDNTIVFLNVAQFMRDHACHAVRIYSHEVQFLVYDEEGTLTWVGEAELERQTTADIRSVPTKKPS